MKKVQMAHEILVGGAPQSLYFPKGHEAAGCFKRMKVILEEQGFGDQIRDLQWARVSQKFSLPSPSRVTLFFCIPRVISKPSSPT